MALINPGDTIMACPSRTEDISPTAGKSPFEQVFNSVRYTVAPTPVGLTITD